MAGIGIDSPRRPGAFGTSKAESELIRSNLFRAKVLEKIETKKNERLSVNEFRNVSEQFQNMSHAWLVISHPLGNVTR